MAYPEIQTVVRNHSRVIAYPGVRPEYADAPSLKNQAGAKIRGELTVMEKTYTTQEVGTCPVCCYPLTSSWHLAGCEMSKAQQIVEVSPPEWTHPEYWVDKTEAQAELFPVASIAHELKTPMVVMLGYTDMLQSGQLGPVNPNQRQILREMQQSGERLQRLVTNMLRLCELRHHNGRLKQEIEAAEVNQLARMLFDHWKLVAKKKSIRYEFVTASNACWVQMSPIDLHLAVSNLIENALKFTPDQGTVLVTVKTCFWESQESQQRLRFDIQEKPDRKIENAVQIDVRDTGPGIPPERRREVFRDFVRLPGAHPGNGLGLAIARRLVMTHGGRIWVDSAPAGGSNFSILLPMIASPIDDIPALRPA
jgi:K+-sensing histidine kinase KdpD